MAIKMNKKYMSKIGAISTVLIVTILAITISLFFLVSASTQEQYTPGEKIKIQIGNIGEYTILIQTPDQKLVEKSSKPYFIYQPIQEGEYSIKIKGEDYEKEINFKIEEPTKETIPEESGEKNPQKSNTPTTNNQQPTTNNQQPTTNNQQPTTNNQQPTTNNQQPVVGEPYKWKKKFDNSTNIKSIKIPKSSSNISVKGNPEIDFKVKEKITDEISNIFSDSEEKTLVITNIEDNFEVEYETPAPKKSEKIISGQKKEVEISSEMHYENVLVRTNLTKEIPKEKEYSIKVYWKEEGIYLNFISLDKNNNSLIDQIEWTAPHLSTQTFEIIIEISDASHLNQNKTFLENIFDKVNKKDGIWQLIPQDHFARVTFEKNLTNQSDITIYAKSNDSVASIEVYEKDSNTKLAEFESITEESYYKILLTKLTSSQNTFDLLVKGGSVLFDLIIDPFIQTHFTGFETDSSAPWDGWIDGGSDCARSNVRSYCTDTTCAGGGSWSLDIKDNAAGSYTEQTFDLSSICAGEPCEYVTLSFWAYYESAIDAGEELDVKCDGTTIWSCYPDPNNDPGDDSADCSGTGIENNWRFHEINLSNPEFGSCTIDSSVTLRFESEFSADSEESWIDGINITGYIGNLAPSPSPQINSTDGSNDPSQDLNCFDTLTDGDGDSMNVSIRWYKDSVLNLSATYNNNYANGTFFKTILNNTNTSNGENWMCSMQLTDGTKTSSWVNSTSIFVSDVFVDYNPLTCDDIWGNCGTGEPDNTFDSCANSAGTDERIEDIYLNSTAIKFSDTIEIICEYYTTETVNDELYVYYRNSSSSSWRQIAAGSSSGTGGSIRNWTSVTISPDQVTGVHQARCIIDFDGGDGECAAGSYFDNDDVNFTVSPDSNIPNDPTPEINSTQGTNYPFEDLNCFSTISDPNTDPLNVTTRWYKNSILNLTLNYTDSYPSGTNFNSILTSPNTSDGENWMCSMQLTDGTYFTSWINSSIIPVSAIFVNYTGRTCDDVWGDCGAGEGDNTFDSCASGAGGDERIENIYLNQTSAKFGQQIQVTCEYYSTETTADELYLYYRNSSTGIWVQQATSSSVAPGSTLRNWTAANISVDSVEGEHQVRCIIDYDGTGTECASGSWFDNDDVNFTVVSNSTEIPTPQIISPIGTTNDPTPLLDLYLNITARTLWYNINGSENQALCTSCSENQQKTLFLDAEGSYQLNTFANNTLGNIGQNTTTFTIDLNNNFYDNFTNNDSVLTYDSGITWQQGSLNYTGLGVATDAYGFETGELGDDWTTYSSNAFSRISVRTNDAHDGTYSVIADSNTDNNNELSELISTKDFSGTSTFNLSFWYREWDEEFPGGSGGTGEAPSDHSGHQNSDALYFTCDGNYWYYLYDFDTTNGDYGWHQANVSVSADPDFCSEINESFAIKFTQYDNYDLNAPNTDGIAWDDISITYDGITSSEAVSRPIQTLNQITEFTNISWNSTGSGNVSLQVSVNNGSSWTNATNNQPLLGFTAGNVLKYKAIFSGTGQVDNSLLDLNLSWSNQISPAPSITINSPSPTTFPDVTPILNITINGTAHTLWYTLDGQTTTICKSCTGNFVQTLYLEEGDYSLVVYANNSVGDQDSETSTFTIDMNENYFDTYLDDSQIWTWNGPSWQYGNISYNETEIGTLANETFDTDLNNWTFPDGTWTLVSGGVMRQGTNTAPPGGFAVHNNIDLENGKGYEITFSAYDEDNDENGILFRYKDTENFYKCSFRIDTNPLNSQGLIKVVGGTSTTIANITQTYTRYAWNDYKLTIEENNISCYLNGQLVATAIDATWEDGAVGMTEVYHQNALYDNFTVDSWITEEVSATSYKIKTIDNIVEILNVSWNEFLENSSNDIRIQLSPDNGNTWYNTTKNQGIVSITPGNELVYKVIFDTIDSSLLSLLDLNITWSNTASPAPTITVTDPADPLKDVTPIIETSISGLAEAYWYTINSGSPTIICTDCSGGDYNITPILSEGDFVINFYANNSVGSQSTAQTSFEVDMQRNYFDTYPDQTQIKNISDATWQYGQLTFTPSGKGIFETFEGGSLSSDWTTYTSDAQGDIVISALDSYQGTHCLLMDMTPENNYNLNELITSKDFSGARSVYLSFWAREWDDEFTAGSDHSSHQNADAVYFTCDGNYWYHLQDIDITNGDYNWYQYNINISADPNYCPSINSSFAIKLTQYDNYNANDTNNDGIGFDNINISIPGGYTEVISHPINVSQNIRRISNITWSESGTDPDNKIDVNLSVDYGNTWFTTTSGSSASGFTEGSSLVYKIIFSNLDDTTTSLLDLNITWEEPPSITIHYPENSYVYNTPITKMNYSVTVSGSETLDSCWWTNDSGATNYSITCEADITTSSVSGVNTWTVYANDSSGSIGSDTVQFIVDTAAPSIVFINQTPNPIDEGSDFEINVNVTDSNLDKVWIVIWENVVGGAIKFKGFLSNLFGDLFNIAVPTNQTFNLTHNYTIYANDTTGLQTNYSGNFTLLKMYFFPDDSPIYTNGSKPAYITGQLNTSEGNSVPNHPINIWFENSLIPFENLTANGVYLSEFNFTGKNDIFDESLLQNVSYNGTTATLTGTNTSGSMSGTLDAGAQVDWGTIDWSLLTSGCSGTITYQNGNSWGYSSTSDTYIQDTTATTNYGTSQDLFLDTSPDIQRTLLKFENIFGYGLNKIPYDSSISSANLNVNVYDTGNAPTIYEILEDWEESQATYNGRLSGTSWSSTGVAGYPSRSTTSLGTISASTIGTKTLSITNLAREWNNRSKENYGFVFQPGGSSGVILRSSEYGTASERPSMDVTFSSTECAGIQVYIRTSNDQSTWSAWQEIQNGQNITDTLSTSRYLQYNIVFGSFNTTIKPYLWDIKFNYSAISTDASGKYNYSFDAPITYGTYDLNLSSGLRTISANQYLELKVQSGIDPVVTHISPANNTISNTANITIQYNATDLNDDLAYSVLYVDGTNVSYNQTPMINGQNSFNYTFTEGVHTYEVKAFDSTSLNDTTGIYTITVDLTPPTITLSSPPNASNYTVGYLNLTFTPLDNLDSSLTCNVTFDGTNIAENQPYTNNTPTNVTTPALADGLHYWNVTCIDEALWKTTSQTWQFNVSDTPPTVTLVSPADNSISTSQDVNFTFTPDDNSGITICQLLIDGSVEGNVVNPTLGANATILASGISEGYHDWSIRCTDLSSTQVQSENRTLGIDISAPTIEIFNPADNYQSSDATPDFDIRINDTIDTQPTCDLVVDGSISDTFNATSGVRFNITSDILEDGNHPWYLNCSDDLGNYASSTPRNINISEAPTVILNSTNDTYHSTNSFTIYYTPSDNTGLTNCTSYLNGVQNVSSATIANNAQNFLEIPDLTDGVYTYYVTCLDAIGLSGTTPTQQFTIDNAAPTPIPHFPLNEPVYASNITFNFTATDTLSPQLNCTITVDNFPEQQNIIFTNNTNQSIEISGIEDGTHLWNLTCYDQAGNANTSLTYNFTRYTAPGVSLVSPSNETWTNSPTINLTYYPEDDEGFSKAELYLNGELDSQNSTPVISGANNTFTKTLSEGTHTWYVKVTDITLSETDSETWTFYIDTTSPIIALGLPSQDDTYDTNNVTFNFSVTDNLDQNPTCDLFIGADKEWSGNVTNATEEITNILLVDGNYTYKINCSDEAGNQVTSPETNFTVLAPPKINLVSPSNETYTQNSSINFSYIPLDAIGLLECSIYLDGNNNQTSYSVTENVQNNFTITGIPEGIHNWSVECTDSDSNVNNSITRIFYRDLTPPYINLTGPENDSAVNAQAAVSFTWIPTDTLDYFLSCDLVVDGNIEDTSFATSGFERTEPVSGLSEGTHYWNVTCTDQAGNSNTSETRVFNYTYTDIMLNETSISFSNQNPTENEAITISAKVYNLGGFDSTVDVKFYNGDPEDSGIQIGSTRTILIQGQSSNTTSIQWPVPVGSTNIFAIADFPSTITEVNETNNKANKTISVGSWHFFYGSIDQGTNLTLSDSPGYEVTTWDVTNATQANIYVTDLDSSINWTSLQAIGKTISGSNSSNDIQEIDSALNMTSFEDSHEAIYLEAGQINETKNYTIFSKTIENVPITNSINSTNFKTGILWDTSDSGDQEYNETEKEDIVYITELNKGKQGSYEITDYELRVPAYLRNYDSANSQSAIFYLEII